MTDKEWNAWCFHWWTPYVVFTVDVESYRLTDMSDRIPSEGWVP